MNRTIKIDKNLIEFYSGGNYDRLSDESKMLTATAWCQYPATTFHNLVEEVRGLNTEWADLIAEKGVNYFVLAEGDIFCSSGCVSKERITCDTEEWYLDIGKTKFISTSDDFDNEWEELTGFIEKFAFEICQEVSNEVNKMSESKVRFQVWFDDGAITPSWVVNSIDDNDFDHSFTGAINKNCTKDQIIKIGKSMA